MNIEISDFEFNVTELSQVSDVDKLVNEYKLQIKTINSRLENREVLVERSESRSEDLQGDITEVDASIAAKEVELSGHAEGSLKHTKVLIELDKLKVRKRELAYRLLTSGSLSPFLLVERHTDNGEAKLLIEYFNQFITALEQRKTELGG